MRIDDMNIHPQAHNTPVYNIQWNTFILNIFITCASGGDIFSNYDEDEID